MNTAKTAIMAMIVAFVAMIGMTGMVSAVTTDVTYTGDGSYKMDFNGDGTGYIGVHTYTGNGEDHLQVAWENAEAYGWQTMDTPSYSNSATYTYGCYSATYENSGSATEIDRVITVGGANDGADASGSILTFTNDTNGNTLYTLATYRDDVAWTSHVTTDQYVSIYQNQYSRSSDGCRCYHSEYEGSNTGIWADTEISGFAYGDDTLVTGLIRSESGDAYVVAVVEMTEGEFDLNVYSNAYSNEYSSSGWYSSGYYSYSGEYAGSYEFFDVDANGVGIFVLGAGIDTFGVYAHMYDDNGNLNIYFTGHNGNVQFITPFDGNFDGTGYVYAVDLP